MQFVTFNIRTEAMADGVNRFFYRKGLILDEIEKRRPDIIGFQEMKHDMNSFMREHLSRMGYTMVGGGRGADYMGEHNPVAFDSSKYELLGLDTSWLSDTPYVPGSRYEKQSSCPRIVTHLMLRPLGEGEPFHVYNTHLDHEQVFARIMGARRVMEKIQQDLQVWDLPLLLCGDFNAYPDSEEVMYIRNHPLGLKELTGGIGTTWHNWGRGSDPQIDYIFVKGFDMQGAACKWDQELNGIYLSDHYPISVEVSRSDGGAL